MKTVISRYGKWFTIAAIVWGAFVALPSFSNVRIIFAAPLVVHEQNARGDACYVLAGGGALWERLDAAADLVQMGRVPWILLMQNNICCQYSFKDKHVPGQGRNGQLITWRGGEYRPTG